MSCVCSKAAEDRGGGPLLLRHDEIPRAAWGRSFWAPPPPKKKPLKPTAAQTLPLLPLGYRMWRHVRKEQKARGGASFMDPFNDWPHDVSHGVPLGGIGCGALGRGWRGDFRRYSTGQVPSGVASVTDDTPHTCFAICTAPALPGPASGTDGQAAGRVLIPAPKQAAKGVRYLDADTPAEGYALYPRAWHVYDTPTAAADTRGVAYTATCEQLSPVIPHNYTDSSLPCGCFEWTIRNRGTVDLDVAVMLTQHNGVSKGAQTRSTGRHTVHGGRGSCVVMEHPLGDDPGAYCVAAEGAEAKGFAADAVRTSACAEWPADQYAQLYRRFVARKGDLPDAVPCSAQRRMGGVAAKVRVPAGETRRLRFSMSWTFPVARFSGTARTYTLKYTEHFPVHGAAAPALAQHALENMDAWRGAVTAWQRRITDDARLPEWYKTCVLNESYYLTAGGSVWTVDGGFPRPRASTAGGGHAGAADAGPAGKTPSGDAMSDVSDEDFIRAMEDEVWAADAPPDDATAGSAAPPTPASVGHFIYLEGHEYRMFNSYDVHFYASFALACLFPELQASVTLDLAKAFLLGLPERRQYLGGGDYAPRKDLHTIPHDAGGPSEAPWEQSNIYCIHNVSLWKDLPLKFVLMVYRDYVACGSRRADLERLWGAVRKALDGAEKKFARRGMVVNDAWPDQTYDAWSAEGVSAYTGGLWLAALRVAEAMAQALGRPQWETKYARMLHAAQQEYEQLWNAKGGYYNYSNAAAAHADSIMADQGCGEWYVRACGLPSVLPAGRARTALQTVHRCNVLKFGALAQKQHAAAAPLRGAVNGMRPDGSIDATSMQSSECWTGTTFAVAAHMHHEGLTAEAFETAQGVAVGSNAFGFWFNTPEAWLANGNFRSLAYMRPLSVWALQWSIDRGSRATSNA
eukprot:TRINITY_DN2152_c0_g1_i1.p1 TRINITY_DN2152_c0_g1~~TRINITY_DN2152_c0_g1_i1.p1  ORF type:complete len:912 (+),score=276.27 TRINITY_DN2152_c0_g1_i1:81-2816(+)